MTTTRRKRTPAGAEATTAVAQAERVTPQSIADFMGLEAPDLEVTERALLAAKDAAAEWFGQALPEELPHEAAHGIRLLTSKLLLENRFEKPAQEDIPLTVRYFWTLANESGAQA